MHEEQKQKQQGKKFSNHMNVECYVVLVLKCLAYWLKNVFVSVSHNANLYYDIRRNRENAVDTHCGDDVLATWHTELMNEHLAVGSV